MGSENSKGENKERDIRDAEEIKIWFSKPRTGGKPQLQTASKPSSRQSNLSSLPQSHSTIERRNPYSYTSNDLQTNRPATTLYPNLQNATRTLAPEQRAPIATPENRHPNCYIAGLGGRSEAEDFVLINNFFGQQQLRSFPKPSAPPEVAVAVTERPQARPTRPPPPRVDSSAPSTSAFANTSSNKTAPTPRSESRVDSSAPSTSAFANTSSNKTAPTPRSESRSRHPDDRYNCPTCSRRLGLTIFQCSNEPSSHSSCSECHHTNKLCGICRSPIINMRNIALEGLIAERLVHHRTVCPNSGCTLSFNEVDMLQHQRACPFGETDCPMGTIFGKCSARYKVDDMADHFDAFHKEQRCADFGKEMFMFNICMESRKMFLVKNGPYNFLVHIKVAGQDRTVYMAVQLFGTAMSASKWTYEFHVYNKSQPRRKFQYVDTCQSISTSVDDIFKESKCATLPLSYAKSFVNEGALTYKFFIKKNEAGQQRRRNGKNYWKRQGQNE